jgi:N-acyl-D-aspartate/D-glutamate deacylase
VLDVLIRGGTVVDGTGAPARAADVAVEDGRIVDLLAPGTAAEAAEIIDAGGRLVTPGFIDMHTHSDFTLLVNPRAESSLHQGVTTEVIGNCGHACAPVAPRTRHQLLASMFGYVPEIAVDWNSFGEYLDRLERAKPSINVAALAGHGPIRIAAMGFASRHARPDEIAEMRRLLEEALADGAVGFSTGLAYAPGANASADEVVALVSLTAEHGKLYATHIRSEDVRLLAGVREALDAARETGARLQLSHHPAKYPAFGKSPETLAMIDGAIAAGGDVACDLHAYLAGATSLSQLLPPWAFEGDTKAVLGRLADGAARARLKQDMRDGVAGVTHAQLAAVGRWDAILLESSAAHPELVGRTLRGIADELGEDPEDAVFELLLAEGENYYNALMLGWVYNEADNEAVLMHPTSMIGSDGFALATYGRLANIRFHPRSFGTYPRILRKFVHERGLLSIEQAIRKMTGQPAERLGLDDRGVLRPGAWADVLVFGADGFADHATYEHPNRYATGLELVLVNGRAALTADGHTGASSGAVLRR